MFVWWVRGKNLKNDSVRKPLHNRHSLAAQIAFFPVSFLYINLPFQALSLILYIWTMLQAKNKNKDINKSKQTKKINNQATNRCILNSLTKVHFTRNASSTYHLTYFIPLESLFHLNVNLWEETCANKSFLKWGDSFKPIGWDMGRGLGRQTQKMLSNFRNSEVSVGVGLDWFITSMCQLHTAGHRSLFTLVYLQTRGCDSAQSGVNKTKCSRAAVENKSLPSIRRTVDQNIHSEII